jgi:hypothetical protein
MEKIFETLTDFALDPFERLAAAGDPARALIAAGLSYDELGIALSSQPPDIEVAAHGPFSTCETCIDPGDDPDPFP